MNVIMKQVKVKTEAVSASFENRVEIMKFVACREGSKEEAKRGPGKKTQVG